MQKPAYDMRSMQIVPVGPSGKMFVGQAEVVDKGRTVFVIVYADSGELGYSVETRSAFENGGDDYEYVLEEYISIEDTAQSKYAELFRTMHDKIVQMMG